ncbi:hypothetical protein ABTI12_20120, partial [Acinetobacter baumannii]
MQFTRLSNRQTLQPINAGLQGAGGNGQIGGGKIVNMPAPGAKPVGMPTSIGKGKVASLPVANAGKNASSPVMKDSDQHRFHAVRQSMQVDRMRSG